MTESELIQKIKQLKEIKPNQDWVILCKNQIMGKTEITHKPGFLSGIFSVFNLNPFLRIRLKPVLSVLSLIICAGFLAIGFDYTQKALPGDRLYSAKKITEQAQIRFASEQEKPNIQLKFTNQKIQELTHIAEANLRKNLEPAIKEVKDSVSKVAKNPPEPKEIQEALEIKKEITKMTITAKEVKSYGVNTDIDKELQELDKNYEENLKPIIENEIENLENQKLDQNQQQILSEIKECYQNANYSEALEKILFLSY